MREVNGKTDLYNMQYDASEKYNQAEKHTEIVEELRTKMFELAEDVGVKTTAQQPEL